ncbi:MAG: ABC transporter ATP-binding protein/permease [Ruminococcus sp.]|nr:ABC transporter ATP-binding protein/permease [Ruminococcus sp.]
MSDHKNTVIKTLRYFYPLALKRFKGFFVYGAAHILITALHPFISIMMTPLIIDELLGARDMRRLIFYAAIIVIGGSLVSLLGSYVSVVLEKYNEKMENFFAEEMSRRVMGLDFQLTEDKKALDQIEAARTGMSWYSGGVYGISTQLFQIISHALRIGGVIILLLLHAPFLFVVTAVLLIINTIMNSKQNELEILAFKKLSRLNRIFSYLGYRITSIDYAKDIRLYDARDMFVEKWDNYTLESIANWKWQADKTMPLNIVTAIAETVRNCISYLYLGILTIGGKITIGIFSQMLSAGNTFHTSMEGLIFSVQEIIKRCNYAYDYVLFMHYPPAIEKGDRHVEDGAHTITFNHVSFTYPGSDGKVLEDVSLTLQQGEHLSIVGLNGAGKTTFVKLLCRLYDPTEGEILLDGINIKKYDYHEYMALFAPVFQDFRLFAFSIRDNLTLDTTCEDAELNALLAQVGLADKIASLPGGVDTMLFKSFDKDGIEPSGGEQQKLAIARALYKKAPIVILDEPTAALDPLAEYDIYRQFNTLVGGKTAIYISHRLSSCKFCDRIAVFSEGKIKEYGTHDELAGKTDGLYAEMFAAQARYYK